MTRRILYITAVLLVVLGSSGIRLYAAQRLDVDYDEPVYLGAAVEYARAMRLGDFRALAWSENTYEHPALYKILYGVALLTQQPLDRLPEKDLRRLTPITSAPAGPWNIAARYLSVFWGTLAVLALSLLNPLAGLFLGLETLSVKYTSEVYLEALPLFTSLLCALSYARAYALLTRPNAGGRSPLTWLIASAVFLGITAASKYVYCVVGIAIAIHFGLGALQGHVSRRWIPSFAAWVFVSVIMFVAFDPYLWPHPIIRLEQSILFHEQFQDSRLVLQYHYPWWQPLRWLSAFSSYYQLGPAAAFPVNLDTLIFLLALVGLPRLYQRERLFFYWLMVGLAFLLAWNTKWPQYTLIVLAPYSLAAAYGGMTLWDLGRRSLLPKPLSQVETA